MSENPQTHSTAHLHDEHKQRLEALEQSLMEKKDELSQVIREYPLTSVLVALGVGIVLGRLLANRK